MSANGGELELRIQHVEFEQRALKTLQGSYLDNTVQLLAQVRELKEDVNRLHREFGKVVEVVQPLDSRLDILAQAMLGMSQTLDALKEKFLKKRGKKK